MQREVWGRAVSDDGGDAGQEGAGEPSAPCVPQGVRKALDPAALPWSLAATARREQERQDLEQRWPPRVERAAYARERAARH